MAASPDRTVAGLVGDRYEITGLIATGGMGSVYRARDSVLDRTVALKVLKAGADDPDFAARFRTEATIAARLSHPNIVQVYDFGSDDGRPYMAMEYVDGQSLREILQAEGMLRPSIAARIAGQVALALEHARRGGIVHRDVKPENILITTDGQVKMADFGLSRALAESKVTQAEVIMGTAHYLAPEQVEGRPAGHAADIYALGIVLFEMLTGRTPFTGDTPVVIAYKRVAEDVPSVLAQNPSAPRALDEVVARATARDAAERYETAAAMGAALRDAAPTSDTGALEGLVHHTEAIPIAGQETIAVPARGPRGAARARKRRRWRALAVLLTVIAGAIYIGTAGPLSKVAVPRVTGLVQSDAKTSLRAQGFDVDETLQNDPEVPAGTVIAQDPADGASVRKGSTVSILVSLGPRFVGVPDARGIPFRAAEAMLREEGFDVAREDVFDPEVPRLDVVAQDPQPGELLEEGATVTLHVSKGVEKVRVPDVTGDPEGSATGDLEAVGFTVRITRAHDDDVPQGDVISQSAKPGTSIAKGSTIQLVVSKGPPLAAVPRVLCMTKRQARDALAAAGFRSTTDASGPRVVDQSPLPGAKAPEGSRVTITLGSGALC